MIRICAAILSLIIAGCGSAPTTDPNSPEGTFIGQYTASIWITQSCPGFTTYRQTDAAEIGVKEEGLNRQKLLATLFYGKADWLKQHGKNTLAARGIDPDNPSQVCRFAKQSAQTEDKIGRFLRAPT